MEQIYLREGKKYSMTETKPELKETEGEKEKKERKKKRREAAATKPKGNNLSSRGLPPPYPLPRHSTGPSTGPLAECPVTHRFLAPGGSPARAKNVDDYIIELFKKN
ncbi:hypothetical protein CEXT_127051 [Caerostris extrusa]|uniref:Uncharacterized protein n=1 Tax=Caerostris extrusa TaxID=172846 RepID=A0AAV4Y3N2_CAEEX|nr:hypothetical protein CEXT_127051 [Caerostris extrusa]